MSLIDDINEVGDSRKSLTKKLHPDNLKGFSPRMMGILAYILGERWTLPWVGGMSITSDGFVALTPHDNEGVSHDEIIGTINDLDDNLLLVLNDAGITSEEYEVFVNAFWDVLARNNWFTTRKWRFLYEVTLVES